MACYHQLSLMERERPRNGDIHPFQQFSAWHHLIHTASCGLMNVECRRFLHPRLLLTTLFHSLVLSSGMGAE
jgi:hypothetical protein